MFSKHNSKIEVYIDASRIINARKLQHVDYEYVEFLKKKITINREDFRQTKEIYEGRSQRKVTNTT